MLIKHDDLFAMQPSLYAAATVPSLEDFRGIWATWDTATRGKGAPPVVSVLVASLSDEYRDLQTMLRDCGFDIRNSIIADTIRHDSKRRALE